MRSHLGRKAPDLSLVLGPVIIALLAVGLALVVAHDDGEVALSDVPAPGQATVGSPVPGVALPEELASTLPDRGPTGAPTDPLAEATAVPPPSDVPDEGGVPLAPSPEPSATGGTATTSPQEAESPVDRPAPAAESPPPPPPPSATTTLTPATCFDGTARSVRDVQPIGCDRPHGNEVYAVFTAPGDASAPYPGEEHLSEQANELCRGQVFAEYVGVPYANSRFFASPLVPTAETWADGDRELACFLYDVTGPRTGSARASAM